MILSDEWVATKPSVFSTFDIISLCLAFVECDDG